MLAALVARVLGKSRPNYGDGSFAPYMSPRGDLSIAQGLPERTELVRMGASFSAQIPAASAFTLLITIPTTRSELTLQNTAIAGTNTYLVIDRFWVKAVTSTASAGVITPLAQLVTPGTTLVADNTAVLRQSLNCKPNYTGVGTLCIASTAVGCLTDKWMHFDSGLQSMTTNIAACVSVDCKGRYIVPPAGNFSMNAQESVSGGTAIIGVEWHEAILVNA